MIHGIMRTVASIAFLGSLCMPAFAQTVLDDSFPNDAGVNFQTVHKAVSADFLDPSSAQYKGMTLRGAIANDPVICGWVNAKNSMGGYGPFVPFHYSVNRAKGATHPKYDDPVVGSMAMMTLNSSGCASASLGL